MKAYLEWASRYEQALAVSPEAFLSLLIVTKRSLRGGSAGLEEALLDVGVPAVITPTRGFPIAIRSAGVPSRIIPALKGAGFQAEFEVNREHGPMIIVRGR